MTEHELGQAMLEAHKAAGHRLPNLRKPKLISQSQIMAFVKSMGQHTFTTYDVMAHFGRPNEQRYLTGVMCKLKQAGKIRVVETGQFGRMVYKIGANQ